MFNIVSGACLSCEGSQAGAFSASRGPCTLLTSVSPVQDESAKKKWQEVTQAYETLKDPQKRQLYDQVCCLLAEQSCEQPVAVSMENCLRPDNSVRPMHLSFYAGRARRLQRRWQSK